MVSQIILIVLLMVMMICKTHAATPDPVPLTLTSSNPLIKPEVSLSQDDMLWLAVRRTLTIGVYGKENPPLAMSNASGRYRGINADYLLLMKESFNISITIQHFDDKTQALAALQSGKVDLVLISQGDAGADTAPLISSLPLVRGYPTLVTRQSEAMAPLHNAGKPVKVAISHHYPSEQFIRASFQKARIVSYADNYQALASVARGENDYFFGDNITTSYIIDRDFYRALGMVKFWRSPQTDSHFVARGNQQRLVDIINIFITSLTEPVHSLVSQSWIETGNLAFLNKPLILTAKEQRWIAKNPVLRVLINPYYAPFTMLDDNREIRGLVGDILNLIQLQTGLRFQPVIASSNDEMAEIMRKGNWDMMPSATWSPEREEKMAFTHPFIATPFVIVTRTGGDPEKIFAPGSTVAIPAYYSLRETLLKKYPGVIWVTAENTSTALSGLQSGQVDGVVTTQLAARYIIDHYYPDAMDYTRIPDQPSAHIAFAVPRGMPELQDILNKALDDIPPKEMLSLAGKWIKMPNIKIDTWDLYSRPFYVVVVLSALLILSSLMWGVYLLRAIRRQKASQAALAYQLRFRQTLSNSIPVPVYVMTPGGDIESFNSAFSAFFTPQKRHDMHHSLYDRRSPLADIFPVVQQEISKGLAPDTVIPCQLVLNNGEEDRTVLHWMTLCPLPASMPPVVICGWQDITESRQLMKALQTEKDKAIEASRAKSTFLARMSHEIRTPVSAIMGFLELLTTRTQSPQEAQESIRLAYETAQSLTGLIGDVLDMEKIESGNFTPAPEWVDMEALIRATMANFDGLASQKNLRLTLDCRLHGGQRLWLDPQAMKQVLTNLISNAIKFTDSGSVEVMAQTRPRDNHTLALTLHVRDSGVGISAREQQQLFMPFSQASSGKAQTGSGLGLTICRELVESMGGSIDMASQPGRGTTMTVSLTVQSSPYAPAVPSGAAPGAELPPALRILIADDNPTNRLLLRRQLNNLGYDVDGAEDGIQALHLIHRQAYDLLITDINMPGMDGITLTQQIRTFNPSLIIWGLTANAQENQKTRCLAAGMDQCLFKPINLPQLTAALGALAAHPGLAAGHPPAPAAETGLEGSPLSEFIDMQILAELTSGEAALMRRLLMQAREENSRDLAAAKQALAQQDRETLYNHLHRINGTAQLTGAVTLHYLAEELEDAVAAGLDLTGTEPGMQRIEQQINGMDAVIAEFMKEN